MTKKLIILLLSVVAFVAAAFVFRLVMRNFQHLTTARRMSAQTVAVLRMMAILQTVAVLRMMATLQTVAEVRTTAVSPLRLTTATIPEMMVSRSMYACPFTLTMLQPIV